MAHYWKAARLDGTDFYSGTIDYAAALASGQPVVHPAANVGARNAAHYLSVSTAPADCTEMRWPCRVFVVEPDGETWVPGAGRFPNKIACTSVRVVEEVSATVALGPQGEQIAALVERCETISVGDVENLAAAWDAAWGAARNAAWDAAWGAARNAAWTAAWDAARNAAWTAAWDAAWGAARWDAAWDAARNAAGTAAGLLVRDLIGQHGLTQDHYDTLTKGLRAAIGPIHPDDAPIGDQ